MSKEDLFEPEIEAMPRPELEQLQEQRVLELIPYVYERSDFYRMHWDEAGVKPADIRSLQDFKERIPFINKDMIRDYREKTGDPYGGILCVDPADLTSIASSSGTTGDPTFFNEQYDEYIPLMVGWVRALWEHGLRPGDHAITGSATFRGASCHEHRILGVVPIAIDSWFGQWDAVLDAIKRYDVRQVHVVGPLISELERLSHHRDMREALAPLKFMTFAGEPMGSRMQQTVREEWDTDLVLWTSAGDTGTAWECKQHDGYHVHEDTVLVEDLVPDQNESVIEGEVGELVTTDLDNVVAPLIRYRAEDLVRVNRQHCECGRTHARFWPLGRAGDLTIVRGKSVMPLEVWAVIEQFDETRSALFQIIRPQKEVDELHLRVGYAPDLTKDTGELRERICAGLAEAVGISPTVELLEEKEIVARASSAAKIPRIAKS
ncbi:phenylacetate--CoA ligase family protein [Mycobacterium paraseoulense]|uniref:Phenylacetate--CoA ligase n=1 Tax=Mycobacterium paraseoulense TaxID=590652 RepID=A0A1X0IEU9_9MYCO|nr:phenylacetate--CoA ligase family protein [Mycobacterium paraseoulense]MCV7393889.1 phenylacetate--CoA ligase family protein [Mycobacterium paraseoulense]ORB45390.1 phenylacetate--CoA ligase [Mycobacterium paraseoulense]